MGTFRPYQSDPTFLLPLRVGDQIPRDDVSWVILEVVDRLNLTALIERYSNHGVEGYHPALLLKLICFGVAIGVRSSRKLATLCTMDVRGLMLCGGLHPAWRTIARFIQDNQDVVPGLFCQVVKICNDLGMVGFKHLSLDGTKVKAAASKNKNRTADGLERDLAKLRDQVSKALAEILENDEQETDEGMPEDLRDPQKRIKKIEKAIADMKAREAEKKAESKAEAKYNMTDPESRLMRTSKDGYQQCYNHQIAVDEKEMVITAYGTSQDASDINLLQQTVEASQANSGRKHEQLTVDTGYFSGENLEYLQKEEIDGYVCPEHDTGRFHKSKFRYDQERDLYVCPAGRELIFTKTKPKGRDKEVRLYCGDCTDCPHNKDCVKSKSGHRQVERDRYDDLREAMRAKMRTESAQEVYRRRKELVEPVIGQLKTRANFDRHLRKGQKAADAEIGLVCLVHNIKRIWHKYKDYQGVMAALNGLAAQGCS